jgi:protein O-GlcNAc transferase
MASISQALAIAQAHCRAGRLDVAEEILRRVMAVDPDAADVHFNLATVLLEQGKLDQAIDCYERLIRLKPGDAQAFNNLGNAWGQRGEREKAIQCYRRAIELDPRDARAENNLGLALEALGRTEEAMACYRRAIGLRPDFAGAHYNLAGAWREQGRLDQAAACYEKALGIEPDFIEARYNLGNACKEQGRVEEAVGCYREALRLRPQAAWIHDNLLLSLHYCPGVTLGGLAQAHAEYERRHARPLRAQWRGHANGRDPDRPLRVGFVSPDLGSHPVGRFLVPVLENLDRARSATICYSDRAVPDEMTARLRAAAGAWRETAALGDEQLAEQIRADRVDILFDMAGHTAGNRLMVFARKPAPIQIAWFGYSGTSGLSAIDYLLADRYLVLPEEEEHYCERVLRMPDGYVCFDSPREAPPVGPLPALTRGHLTLGSFNAPPKVSPQIIAVWAQILRRLPSAELVLAYRGFDDPGVGARLHGLFAGHGVAADRLRLLGFSPRAALLDRYNEIDLALDTFPYSGCTTTCEALWMGVPVVTCPGETFASRQSRSHLSTAGLTETIARDLDEYVELAVRLALDLPRLAKLRADLRPRVAHSPLTNAPEFAENLLTLLGQVWRTWSTSNLQ